jgi:hypothetical protein
MHVPPGHQRIRAVKPIVYALEPFAPGAVLVVDTDTATRLITAKHAEGVAEEPEREMHHTTCPRCASAMVYPKQPREHERWTQCLNPRCGFGWLRDA